MTVEPIANGRLRVWLTDEELEEWGLTDTQPSMRRVRRLVRQVSAAVGWTDPGRVTAELIPIQGGGVLLVSPWVLPPVDTPAVYHLSDGDALLDLIRRWGYIEEETQPLCSLYANEGGYDLVVYPQQPLSHRRHCLLLEYGTPAGSGEGAAARCGEYGQLIRAGWMLTECAPTPPAHGDPVH